MRNLVTILLAWLGLAGLSENIVEWQNWFQVGILTHWTALKDALLGLLPFHVPSALIDYCVIGGMMMKSFLSRIPRGAIREMADMSRLRDERPDEPAWMLRMKVVGGYLGIGVHLAFLILLWPLHLLSYLRWALRGDAESKGILKHFGLLLVTFIPFLFVCSNILKVILGQA